MPIARDKFLPDVKPQVALVRLVAKENHFTP